MSVLASISDFRAFAGAAVSTVPDTLIQAVLDEAEAAIEVEVALPVDEILTSQSARNLAYGEELRRASRLLARRNSPEAISGFGDLAFQVPVRDPDSFRTVSAIRSILVVPEGVS